MEKREIYKPENHPYTEHKTYTGPGCAICGKLKDLHKPKEKSDGTDHA